jgi:peptide/nickel transport system substrate-binding protein
MILKRLLLPLLVCLGLVPWSPAAVAQTFRWASQGDSMTMDPHSQNESLTNMINEQVYETLLRRNRDLELEPALATEWRQVSPTVWRIKLRPGVKFHDGAPLTVDDVVFSVKRAQQPTSQMNNYALAVGEPVKVDDSTVEFRLKSVNPIFLQHLSTFVIMNKAWCEKHRVTRPLDFKNREESHASLNANGTGPFILVKREPGVRTTFKRNPAWWDKPQGNVQEWSFTPIANDATRLAALISGEIDFVIDPAPRDVARLRRTPNVKVIDGAENRIIFIGLDQGRDELLYSSVKGRNPFKDIRVRQALYHAVDIETLKRKLMNDQSVPSGALTPSPLAAYNDASLETRLPFDLVKARQLMAEAGYADGFEFTLDCPNNRYINDEEICIALAGMWAQLKLKVRVNAMPRTTYFPKLDKLDTSAYMMGWGGAITDAETSLSQLYRNRGPGGQGSYNFGNLRNDRADALAAASAIEADPKKREELVKGALRAYREAVAVLPLHRQVVPWAARQSINLVHRPDNRLEVDWVTVGAGKR